MDKRFLFIIGAVAVVGIFLATLANIAKKSPASYGLSRGDLKQAFNNEMADARFKIEHPTNANVQQVFARNKIQAHTTMTPATPMVKVSEVKVTLDDPKKRKAERRKEIALQKKAKEKARRKKRKKYLEEMATLLSTCASASSPSSCRSCFA